MCSSFNGPALVFQLWQTCHANVGAEGGDHSWGAGVVDI